MSVEKLTEKCAVAAAWTANEDNYLAAYLNYEILKTLQHRGADASGIAANNSHYISDIRKLGLVIDAFKRGASIPQLIGSVAIGHNRYTTNGDPYRHLQPYIAPRLGFGFATNGNIPDLSAIKETLSGVRIRTKQFNDSELEGILISEKLSYYELPEAIERSTPYFNGAYSSVAMHDDMIAAFRDPYGIRPLSYGKLEDGSYVVASETAALDHLGLRTDLGEYEDVMPGELIIIDNNGVTKKQIAEPNPHLDLFEFVYFARHDSRLNGVLVNEVRKEFGRILARNHHPTNLNQEDVVVVPVPDTSVPAAEGYAEERGLKMPTQAIIKDRYGSSGRSFMGIDQEARQKLLRDKHSIIAEEIRGKDVILIDDSIVRLNTLPRLVNQLKARGAKSVSVLIASPPVRFPDFYGINTPTQAELAAANMTIDQMRERIGCIYLGFLTVSETVEATGIPYEQLNTSPFTGDYPIDIGARKKEIRRPISEEYMA